MREPYLYSKLKDKLGEPAAEVKAVKEKYRDKEVYIRLDPGYYLVVFFKDNEPVGERVLAAKTKTVRKKGRTYNYTYLRIALPGLACLDNDSKLSRSR